MADVVGGVVRLGCNDVVWLTGQLRPRRAMRGFIIEKCVLQLLDGGGRENSGVGGGEHMVNNGCGFKVMEKSGRQISTVRRFESGYDSGDGDCRGHCKHRGQCK